MLLWFGIELFHWLSGILWYLKHSCVEDTIVHKYASDFYLHNLLTQGL